MTTLRLYNTLTKTKEDFVPLDANNVRMYVCGPTVYDYAHIGNARPVIVFDVLFRVLKYLYPGAGNAADGSRVTYVRNITDIDDKIIERAKERCVPIRELTEQTYAIYKDDVRALGCLDPSEMPRATDYVSRMIAMIEELIAAGHAYRAEGHVLFDVSSKPDYGKLARRSLDEMIAGARVDIAPYKKSPMDFVLWKPSDDATPGWESPWGRGRPGWHIECSAMIEATMGETIDIHGGGIDLVFPHHENEIAQSEGAHRDHPLAKIWMHNGFLQVEGEKMSKSLGNFVTINELLQDWPGDVLRFNMLRSHYRQPMDWTVNRLAETRAELQLWAVRILASDALLEMQYRASSGEAAVPHRLVLEALLDDINTPHAITALRTLSSAGDLSSLAHSCEFLGLLDPKTIGAHSGGVTGDELPAQLKLDIHAIADQLKVAVLNGRRDRINRLRYMLATQKIEADIAEDGYISFSTKKDFILGCPDEVQELLDARNAARKAKDFKESDRIRDELLAQGIVLKDNADGTTSWEVKR